MTLESLYGRFPARDDRARRHPVKSPSPDRFWIACNVTRLTRVRELRREIEIDAPPAAVWGILTDFGA